MGRHSPALPGGFVALQQQPTKLLFELIMGVEGRVIMQVALQLRRLFLGEMVGSRRINDTSPRFFGADGVELLPEIEEVVIDKANHMKTVGHDEGVGEVLRTRAR
jgi:hypothetical protein